ncbi:MAG: response regulator, partial [Bacteroidota bacterium]
AIPVGDYTLALERELKALGATVLHRPQLSPDFHPVGYDIILYDPATLLSSTQRERLHAIENAIPVSLQIEGAANLPTYRQTLLNCIRGVLEAPSTQAAAKTAHLRTLLIEDEPFAAAAIRQQLSPYRFELLTVDSGLAALRRAQQQAFDIVLMDWQLPDVEPERVIQKLGEVQPEAKLVVLSGYDETQVELAQKIRRQLAGWMSKPLNIKRLFELLELDAHTLRRSDDEPPQHVQSPRTTYRLTPALAPPAVSTPPQTLPSKQFLQLLLPLVNELQVSLSRGDYDALFTPLQLLKAYLSRTDWEALQTPVRRFERKLQELDIEELEPILEDIHDLAIMQLATTRELSS